MASPTSSSPPYVVDFKYHVNLILNDEGDEETDVEIAENFCEEFIRRFETAQYKFYFPSRDTPAGCSYFDALFDGVENAKYTVILLTPGFVLDKGWNQYCQRVAQFSLMKSEVGRFIPIALGLEKSQVPKEFRNANIKVWNFPGTNWATFESGWNKLRKHLFSNDAQQISGVASQLSQPSWRMLNDQVLNLLTDNLGHEWQTLALNLGVQYARIEQCRESYPTNVHMQIFKTLWTWRQYHDGNEKQKCEALHRALSKTRRNDLAELVKDEIDKYEQQQQPLEPSVGGGHRPVQELDRAGNTSFVASSASTDQTDAAPAENRAMGEGDNVGAPETPPSNQSPPQDVVDSPGPHSEIDGGGDRDLDTTDNKIMEQQMSDLHIRGNLDGESPFHLSSSAEPVGVPPNEQTVSLDAYDEVGEIPESLQQEASGTEVGVSEGIEGHNPGSLTEDIDVDSSKLGASEGEIMETSQLDNSNPVCTSNANTDLQSVTSSAINEEHLRSKSGESIDSGFVSLDAKQGQSLKPVSKLPDLGTSQSSGACAKPVVHVAPNTHLVCPASQQNSGEIEGDLETEVKEVAGLPSRNITDIAVGSENLPDGNEEIHNADIPYDDEQADINATLPSNTRDLATPNISGISGEDSGSYTRTQIYTAGLVIGCSILAMVVIGKYVARP